MHPDAARFYVRRLFEELADPDLVYHNLDHTLSVVNHTNEIGAHYALDDNQLFIVEVAAWFHDTGHLVGAMSHHEEISVELMREFLMENQISRDIQDDIAKCILATKMPVHPTGLLQEILCDADTYHLGTDEFERIDQLVWQEIEIRMHQKIEDRVNRSIQFMRQHQFYTPYCRELLSEGKKKNIEMLLKKKGQ